MGLVNFLGRIGRLVDRVRAQARLNSPAFSMPSKANRKPNKNIPGAFGRPRWTREEWPSRKKRKGLA